MEGNVRSEYYRESYYDGCAGKTACPIVKNRHGMEAEPPYPAKSPL